jgi:hypothetical protein
VGFNALAATCGMCRSGGSCSLAALHMQAVGWVTAAGEMVMASDSEMLRPPT